MFKTVYRLIILSLFLLSFSCVKNTDGAESATASDEFAIVAELVD